MGMVTRVMNPKAIRYARFFCAGAIFASIVLNQLGLDSELSNMGASSVIGLGALALAKKLAFVV